MPEPSAFVAWFGTLPLKVSALPAAPGANVYWPLPIELKLPDCSTARWKGQHGADERVLGTIGGCSHCRPGQGQRRGCARG